MIIEFIVAKWMILLNIYLIGYLVSVVVSLVLSGMNDEDPEGILKESLTWFLDVFHLIGVFILIIKNKGKK